MISSLVHSLTFGNKLKATLEAGRWNLANGANAQSAIKKAANDTDDAANYQGIMLNGTTGKLYGGAAYRHFSSAAFTKINDDASSDDANLWSVGAGYKFDHNWICRAHMLRTRKQLPMLRRTTSSSTIRVHRRPIRFLGCIHGLSLHGPECCLCTAL